jgi:hypothetical protein
MTSITERNIRPLQTLFTSNLDCSCQHIESPVNTPRKQLNEQIQTYRRTSWLSKTPNISQPELAPINSTGTTANEIFFC